MKSKFINQLIQKNWSKAIEKEFAEQVEEKVATENLDEPAAKQQIMKLYKKYLPKLADATDDFWDLLEAILHGITASTKGQLKKKAVLVSELNKMGIPVTEDEKVKKAEIVAFLTSTK
jgi:hypothetical protein